MTDIFKEMEIRLGYKEFVTLSRDDFQEMQFAIEAEKDEVRSFESELNAKEDVSKSLDTACDIMEDLLECIDDTGHVTPVDSKILAKTAKNALKFLENVKETK